MRVSQRQYFKPKRPAQLLLYVVLLLIVVFLMLSLRWCSTPPSGNQRTGRASGGDTIDVAISYSPMTLYRYADTLGGFSYDMLRSIASANGMVLKFHPVTSTSAALTGLREGLFDLIVSDMARTTEVDSAFAYSSDVYLDRQVLVQPVSSDSLSFIASQLDLAGRNVWVEASSPAYMRLRNLANEIGDTITIHADSLYTSEQLFLSVAVGDVPCAVVNESVARRLSPDYPQVDISIAVSFTQFQAWMMRRNDASLRSSIDSAITRFTRTPKYVTLLQRYGLSYNQ